MTRQEFAQLAAQDILVLDGATGSNMIKAGMPRGFCSEDWILENPQPLIDLQRSYVEAGSQIVYAPTFSCNRIGLGNFGLADRMADMNRELVALSKEAVGGRALIAGDLTTTGEMMAPRGPMTYEKLLDVYKEHVTCLLDAGVDLLGAETMLSVEETMAFVDAATSLCDLPIMCTLTLQADGTALYGGDAIEAVVTLQEMGASAVGLNCSVGPDQLEAVIRSMAEVATVPIIAKPNAGMPTITETGEAVYSMNAVDFGRSMKMLVNAGARIVGGCCGTDAEYIREVCKNVKKH